jgi:CheY-like chemotaxis protein
MDLESEHQVTNDRVNLLMVDDQPAKLLSYEAILEGLGENLIKAGSAREALEILLKTEVAGGLDGCQHARARRF